MDYSKLCYITLLRIEGLLTAYIGNQAGQISHDELIGCINSELNFISKFVENEKDRA